MHLALSTGKTKISIEHGFVKPDYACCICEHYGRRTSGTEREERPEERFRWICVTSLLIAVLAVAALDGSWLFLPIFMLQLIALIGFAKAYRVDWAEQLIGQLLYWVSQRGKCKKG